MEWNALRSIDALRRYGSLAAAASQLGYSPSAVSQQLSRLQAELQVSLTRPQGRGIALTESGLQVAETARVMLGAWEDLSGRLEEFGGAFPREIRIAVFPTAVRGLMTSVISQMKKTISDLEVHVIEERSHIAMQLLRDGEVDLCISHDWPNIPLEVPQGLVAERVGLDQVDVVVPASHRLAGRESVRVTDLRDETWAIEPGSVALDLLNSLFAEGHRAPRILYHVREYTTQLSFIEASLAVGLIPRLGRIELPSTLVAIPTSPPAVRRVYAVARRTLLSRPVIQLMLRTIRDAYAAR